MSAPRPSLGKLAWLIVLDSSRTWGGGTASTEQLRRSFGRRGWLAAGDHRQLYAVARLTPGMNLLAYCTALGWHLRGAAGAAVAWVAASLPASAIAVVATVLYDSLPPSMAMVVLAGMTVALALLVSSAWQLARPQLVRALAWRSAVIVAAVLAGELAGASPVTMLLASAVIGALWPCEADTDAERDRVTTEISQELSR